MSGFTPRTGPIMKRRGANLPHWTADNAHYFVTFRLADSLPQSVLEAYRIARERMIAALRGDFEGVATLTAGDLQNAWELFTEKIDRYLDAGTGQCWMKNPEVAEIVHNALQFFHEKRYQLAAWSVMPNHVHVVFQPLGRFHLSSILHTWKSYTAKEANRVLRRKGTFWQAESYDHLVRGIGDFRHCVAYTLDNPAKARLSEWPWKGSALDTPSIA